MPSSSLVLPASTLLMLGLCWSVSANPTTERTASTGDVTNYFTPVADLSLDKLVGLWYAAEYVSPQSPSNISPAGICLLLDFHYDVNGTMVAEPITLLGGTRASPNYTFPVSEKGVWEVKSFGVAGEVVYSTSHVVLHVDDRFLAEGTCKSGSVEDCGAFVWVRHLADADRQAELQELHRRLANANAGLNDTEDGYVRAIEPCNTLAAVAPELLAQGGTSTPDAQ